MLNDWRERNGEHVPIPANQPGAIPPAVQEELQTLKRALEKLVGDKPSYIEHKRRKGPLFSPRIAAAEIPSKFKMLVLLNYTGEEDPVSHVNKFKIQMNIQKVSQDARCHIFPATLSDTAKEGYFKFPPASIDSWDKFV